MLSKAKLEDAERTPIANAAGWARFRNRVVAELERPFDEKCSNIPHLAAIFQTALEELGTHPGGSFAIEKKFSYAKPRSGFFRVDVVSRDGRRWTKIKAESAKNIHRKCNLQAKHSTEHNILHVARNMLEGAASNYVHFRAPEVCFRFARGVTQSVSSKLQELGIVVVGEIVSDPPLANVAFSDSDEGEGEEGDQSEGVEDGGGADVKDDSPGSGRGRVNLDVTAAVALISDMCNPSPERDRLPYQFDGIFQWMQQDELEHPAVPLMEPYLTDAVMCESAWRTLSAIMQTIAGPLEKDRFAQRLADKITVVADQPSTRALALARTKKINASTIAVFGTGDTLRIPTLTANASFLRAAKDRGVDFSAVLHPARALSEDRRTTSQAASIAANGNARTTTITTITATERTETITIPTTIPTTITTTTTTIIHY